MPKAYLAFLGICSNWKKRQHFDKLYQFLWFVTIQIQTRHVKDHIKEKNSTILFIDQKILMFDPEGVRNTKMILSLSICSSHLKSKKLVLKRISG